jgi:DNA ligase (NAD+)
MGIRHVGESTAKSLAKFYGTLSCFLEADATSLRAVPDIGEKIAIEIVKALQDPEFVEEVRQLESLGIQVESGKKSQVEHSGKALNGKRYVITGTLPMPRDEIKELIELHGGIVLSSVSKKTDFLLAGEEAGSKLQRAADLGVTTLDWAAFQEQLKARSK